jgi:hypothetical protein
MKKNNNREFEKKTVILRCKMLFEKLLQRF